MKARRMPLIERLSESQTLQAKYWQRRCFTFTEIAERLGVDRERVVQTLYWDIILRKA
jgi:hypothetical protein